MHPRSANGQHAIDIDIASDWNVKASGFGCVTRFLVRKLVMDRCPNQKVGGQHHTESWVPAEGLEAFNQNRVDLNEVDREYSA